MRSKIVLYIIIVSIAFSSCEEALIEKPRDFLSPNNLPQTEEDCEMILNGALHIQGSADLYDRRLILCAGYPGTDYNWRGIGSDDSWGQLDRANVLSTNSDMIGTWARLYDIINETNVMIRKIPETSLNENVKEKFVASARFLRALYYFHLVRLWGPNAMYLDAPIEDFVAAGLMENAGNVEVFYDLIKSDIEYAVGKNPSGENRLPTEEWPEAGRPTYGAAKALQSKIYLTMAGYPINKPEYWEMARDAALEVIDLGRYSLWPDIETLFLQENEASAEFVYSIQHDLNINPSMLAAQTRPDEGWHFFYADTTWIRRYFEEKDIRRENYMIYELQLKYYKLHYTQFWGEQQPYIGKWKDIAREKFPDYNKRTGSNFPVFRISEVYLMIAEAENEVNGPTALAYEYLNATRIRAGLDPLSRLSKDDFREEMKNERMRELCFELKNRYDIHRWGDLEKEMLWDKHARDNFNMSEDEYLPIPNRDALLNPNLSD